MKRDIKLEGLKYIKINKNPDGNVTEIKFDDNDTKIITSVLTTIANIVSFVVGKR